MRGLLAVAVVSSVLAGCATTPPAPAEPAFDSAAALTAIRAAGAAGEAELVVRSLGDPQVEDLRQRAVQLQEQGLHAEAAAVLDQALAISPQDPRLLQERAEAALLLHDLDAAARLARQAIAIGTEVGPQCRRHWETIVQVLTARAPSVPVAADTDTDTASGTAPSPELDAAIRQRDACTVAAPPRY